MAFDDAAYEQMSGYPWPGNVRELENVIERAVILKQNGSIEAEDLALNNVKTDHQLPLYELEIACRWTITSSVSSKNTSHSTMKPNLRACLASAVKICGKKGSALKFHHANNNFSGAC